MCDCAPWSGRDEAAWIVLPAAAAGASVFVLVALLFRDEFALKLQKFVLGR